jgi:hypothetical protein
MEILLAAALQTMKVLIMILEVVVFTRVCYFESLEISNNIFVAYEGVVRGLLPVENVCEHAKQRFTQEHNSLDRAVRAVPLAATAVPLAAIAVLLLPLATPLAAAAIAVLAVLVIPKKRNG